MGSAHLPSETSRASGQPILPVRDVETMTLATRLSLFFLAALGLVLVGFSATLYGLAHSHLSRQLEERANAALATLTAAVELEDGHLEWDSQQRLPAFRAGSAGGPLAWGVFDEAGRLKDGLGDASLFAGRTEPLEPGEQVSEEVTWQGVPWRVVRRTVWAEDLRDRPETEAPRPAGQLAKNQYRLLVLTAGVPVAPVHATLRTLAIVLTVLTLALWTAAAFGGRWLCARALAPVTRMAQSARSITAADLSRRLPDVRTGDELEDFGRAFNDLLSRIQDSFERQQRFTGEASHQLRTPLTAMLGQLDVALRRERAPEDYRRALGSVRKQVVQLQQIVEMLLFLARADAEARLPALERLDLGAWLMGHLESWQGHARRADIRPEVIADGPLWVKAHPSLLGQAVDNLLDNACKYSAPGSPIFLRVGRDGEEVSLAVEDEGHGIAAEELPHVFDLFFRSADARRRGIGGVGLGLAVTRRVIAAFGGRIEVSSQPGKGSRFVITLAAAPVG